MSVVSKILTRGALAAPLALAVLLGGCGKGESGAADLPKAGEVKILSVTEAPSPERGTILVNGDFDNWYAGAPGPEGVQLPDPKFSVVRRAGQAVKKLRSRFQVDQIWSADDAASPPDKLFAAFADGVAPNATFKLHVVASGTGGMTARLSAYEVVDGKYELLAKDAIVIKSENFIEYDATITSKKGGRIAIVANAGPLPKDKGRVVWHLWALSPA